MATFSRRAVKLVAAVSSVPVLGTTVGLSLRSVHAENNPAPSRIFKACELPLYKAPSEEEKFEQPVEIYPRNVVEEKIGVVRRSVWDVALSGKSAYEQVRDTVDIGVEHTKSTIDFVQSNPGDLPRYAFIAVAGMGGVVLGYRGGIFRKIVYSSIAIGSSTALCYPKAAVDLSYMVRDELNSLWVDMGGKALVDQYWPSQEGQQTDGIGNTKVDIRSVPAPAAKEDPGQSNPNDKDMYSTRS